MNKVVFITGGANGIGAASVKKFLEKGYNVGFLDKDELGAKKLMQELPEKRVLFSQGDVSNVSDIRQAIEATVKKFGTLSSVFANAGIYQSKSLHEMTEEDWFHLININLKGMVFTVKEALPYLIKNKGGSVVLMGSDQCFIGKSRSCAYGMSKGAIAQFTRSTALDYAKDHIRVNAVCPATIQTDLAQRAVEGWAEESLNGDVDEAWRQAANAHPIGRCGKSEEVANFVYFLASDESSFTTGSLHPIDGGLTAA